MIFLFLKNWSNKTVDEEKKSWLGAYFRIQKFLHAISGIKSFIDDDNS